MAKKTKSEPGRHDTWEIPEEILRSHPSIMPIPHDYVNRGETNKYDKWVRVIRADRAEQIEAENQVLKQKLGLMNWLYSCKIDNPIIVLPKEIHDQAIQWVKDKTGFQRPVQEHAPFIHAWEASYHATMKYFARAKDKEDWEGSDGKT